MGVFDVAVAMDTVATDAVSRAARSVFDFRQVVAPRFISERMNITEVTELSVCPSRTDAAAVLLNVGRRHLVVYNADDESAVAADVAALRRW